MTSAFPRHGRQLRQRQLLVPELGTSSPFYHTNFTTNATGLGSYHASGVGSKGAGGLVLTGFTLDGGSTGSFSSAETGTLRGSNFVHTESYNGTADYHMAGSLNNGAPGWSFSNYASTVETSSALTQTVDGNTDATGAYNLVTVLGSGSTGTQTMSGNGWHNWNGGNTSYSYPDPDHPMPPMTVPLTGPDLSGGTMRPTGPEVGTIGSGSLAPFPSWLLPDGPTTASEPGGVLRAMAKSLGAMYMNAMYGDALAPAGWRGVPSPSGSRMWLAVPAAPGVYLAPPTVAGAGAIGPMGPWVGVKGVNAQYGAWGWLGYEGPAMWKVVNAPYNEALTRTGNAQPSNNPTQLTATQIWNERAAWLPSNTVYGRNWQAVWNNVVSFTAGFVDTLTFGLSRYLRMGVQNLTRWLNSVTGINIFDTRSAVNENSNSYRYGTYAGQVADIVLTLIPGYGALRTVIRVARTLQAIGGGISAVDAALQGNWGQAAMFVGGALLQGMRARTGSNSACSWLNSSGMGPLVGRAQQGLMLYNVGSGVYNGVQQIINGDAIGGFLSIGQAGANAWQASRACFRGRMLVDVDEGKKRADAIRVGDRVASRSEYDPEGPVAYKEVEEVFVSVSQIWYVDVAGERLETTPEHPFYVAGKGWLPAMELQVGDLLSTRNGLLVPVEAVADSGEIDTVYNWRVADYHTYFVSATEDCAAPHFLVHPKWESSTLWIVKVTLALAPCHASLGRIRY